MAREKQLKKWRRDWKTRSVEDMRPLSSDLYPTLNMSAVIPDPAQQESGIQRQCGLHFFGGHVVSGSRAHAFDVPGMTSAGFDAVVQKST